MFKVGASIKTPILATVGCFFICSFQSVQADSDILDSLTVTGSVFSEPIHLGLSEAHGRPGVALSLDLEVGEHFYIGVNGYRATDSPAPNRSENYTIYGGAHWGDEESTQFDLTLLHRSYPGDFDITWDYTELQFDVHFSQNLTLSLIGAIDYYGINEANSLGVIGSYVHDFSDNIFSRIEGGTVQIDGRSLESYEYITVGGGYRFDRLSIEALYKTNNAEPNAAFRRPQLDDGFVATINWLIY